MTRPCGCGGNAALTCNCVLLPGVRATVVGTGTPDDPYVISVDPVSCEDVQDCVAVTIGDGLAWDPVTRRITVRPSTDAGNVLIIGTDGGVYVSPDGIDVPAQPRGRMTAVGGIPQIVTGGAAELVLFTTAPVNVGNTWNAATPSRLVAPRAGGYNIGATVQLDDAGAGIGYRAVYLRLNGGPIVASERIPSVSDGEPVTLNVSTSVDLVAGDYLEVLVQSDPDGVRVVRNAWSPTAWMYYTTE